MLRNSRKSYGSVTILFHWLTAVLVISMIFAGFIMHDLKDYELRRTIYMLHKSFGSMILLLVLIRLIWRIINKLPELEEIIPRYQKIIGRTVHRIFYVILFAMPISGLSMTFFAGRSLNLFGLYTIDLKLKRNWSLFKLAHDYHAKIAYTLIFLISIHTLAAFWHHTIQKTNVLTRIWPYWPLRKR